jgi:hypothetical protein
MDRQGPNYIEENYVRLEQGWTGLPLNSEVTPEKLDSWRRIWCTKQLWPLSSQVLACLLTPKMLPVIQKSWWSSNEEVSPQQMLLDYFQTSFRKGQAHSKWSTLFDLKLEDHLQIRSGCGFCSSISSWLDDFRLTISWSRTSMLYPINTVHWFRKEFDF